MHDDEMTPDEFRAAQASGTSVAIEPGPRPVLVVEAWSGTHHISSGGGGGVSYRPLTPAFVPIGTPALIG